jgi:D-glycerate 3-kinase
MPAIDPSIEKLILGWISNTTKDERPALIGISGAQGSGKSTLAREIACKIGAAFMSLDDFYLSKAKRDDLASRFNPLFATRGVPLTHDLNLANSVVSKLLVAQPGDETTIPAFDKLNDAPVPRADWPVFLGRPGAIIIEGWCLGATDIIPNDLAAPINKLERDHDQSGQWRGAWNNALKGEYADFFARFDETLFLAAPSFDVVLDWRCEQEETLLGIPKGTLPLARRHELANFVQYFERLTRHMLTGGCNATAIARLNQDRSIMSLNGALQRQ